MMNLANDYNDRPQKQGSAIYGTYSRPKPKVYAEKRQHFNSSMTIARILLHHFSQHHNQANYLRPIEDRLDLDRWISKLEM